MKCKYLVLSAVLALPLFVASQSYASPIDLGTAGNFAILAESGISTTSGTTVVGDIGVSPIAATAITGFGLIMDPSGAFSTSSLVTGKVYAADYAPPTPTYMTTAVSDMGTAYTDAAGRAAGVTELGAGNIGGLTITTGVYKWGTGVIIPADVTLSGNANDVWIFQIAGTLDISSGKKVILIGGAQANNIFWQVAGQTTLGTTSQFKGIILDQTAIVMNTGATLNGRALAQTAVTLDSNVVTASGSCCLPHSTTCQDTTLADCQALQGTFGGVGSSCATTVCCATPFADDDGDGDVDQDDFGAFQDCFTGSGAHAVVVGHCKCFDRNHDNKVDLTDFTAFKNCVTGPNVPWSQGSTPACVP